MLLSQQATATATQQHRSSISTATIWSLRQRIDAEVTQGDQRGHVARDLPAAGQVKPLERRPGGQGGRVVNRLIY